jgi:hypothetical protein
MDAEFHADPAIGEFCRYNASEKDKQRFYHQPKKMYVWGYWDAWKEPEVLSGWKMEENSRSKCYWFWSLYVKKRKWRLDYFCLSKYLLYARAVVNDSCKCEDRQWLMKISVLASRSSLSKASGGF